ncbi:hypothetical protein TNCV_802481 [Trichonephila clavipes]|nr:hypothetical protein TNCV_802481 [Trichonephila clavipes]
MVLTVLLSESKNIKQHKLTDLNDERTPQLASLLQTIAPYQRKGLELDTFNRHQPPSVFSGTRTRTRDSPDTSS